MAQTTRGKLGSPSSGTRWLRRLRGPGRVTELARRKVLTEASEME